MQEVNDRYSQIITSLYSTPKIEETEQIDKNDPFWQAAERSKKKRLAKVES